MDTPRSGDDLGNYQPPRFQKFAAGVELKQERCSSVSPGATVGQTCFHEDKCKVRRRMTHISIFNCICVNILGKKLVICCTLRGRGE